MPENNLFELKKRIRAAGQTRKITSTMELIASSRLHRGRLLLADYADFARHMRAAARCLPDTYFAPPSDDDIPRKKGYVVFGGAKGLSGSYGPGLLQYAAPMVAGHLVIAVGSAATTFFKDAHLRFGDDPPGPEFAGAIAQAAKDLCDRGVIDEAYMLSMRGTKHILSRLYPLIRAEEKRDMVLLEPSREAILPKLLCAYMETLVMETHLHAFVAEQIARISAMDNATQNADDIIAGLQSSYNSIRQSSITQEIIMISNAARGGGV